MGYERNGYYPDHDHAEEPTRVTCVWCGWDCDTERDSACPFCGRSNYQDYDGDGITL